MRERMAEAGLDYGDRSHTYNSRLAQELGKWADTQPGGESIHDALYRAYFVSMTNISDIDSLVAIAESCGLDPLQARTVLEQRLFQRQVDEDWQRARSNGITGVPTFFGKDMVVVGCQPYETLEKFVKFLLKPN